MQSCEKFVNESGKSLVLLHPGVFQESAVSSACVCLFKKAHIVASEQSQALCCHLAIHLPPSGTDSFARNVKTL